MSAPLEPEASVALSGGVALDFLAHVGFRLRNRGTVNRQRLATAIVLCAVIPLGMELDALASLTFVTALSCALIAYEVISLREARARVRAAAH